MANKSSSVIVRIEPDIKTKAEAIMNNLGLPVSVVINALYHQIINTRGIPFSLSLPPEIPVDEEMTDDEFNEIINESISQAKSGKGTPADEALDSIRSKIK